MNHEPSNERVERHAKIAMTIVTAIIIGLVACALI